jgi:hypothetical protein
VSASLRLPLLPSPSRLQARPPGLLTCGATSAFACATAWRLALIPRMRLSRGFRRLVARPPALRATGLWLFPWEVSLLLNTPAFAGRTTGRAPLDASGFHHPTCTRGSSSMSWPSDRLIDATPLLGPHYQASSLLRVAPPLCTVSVLSPSWYGPLVTFPVVAYDQAPPQYDRFPCSTHAPALRSCHLYAGHRLVGNRHPPDCSQDGSATLVSMSSCTISTRPQWFTCVHLRNAHPTQYRCAFPSRSRPWLLTTAAYGGLKPPPV